MGNGNLDNLNTLFETILQNHPNVYGMCSPEHDFMTTKDLQQFHVYSRFPRKPIIGGVEIQDFIHRDYELVIDRENKQYTMSPRKFPYGISSLADIPTTVMPAEDFVGEAFANNEIYHDVQETARKNRLFNINMWPIDFPAILYNYYEAFTDMPDMVDRLSQYYKTVVRQFFSEVAWKSDLNEPDCIITLAAYDLDHVGGVKHDNMSHSVRTPAGNLANFDALVNMIEHLEMYNNYESTSAAELYYKLDLKANILLNNIDFIKEDLLSYFNYFKDNGEHITDHLKITQTLYEAQRIRQYMYGEILPYIPHYTPEEFLDLCANAALNIASIIINDNSDTDEFFKNFYKYDVPNEHEIKVFDKMGRCINGDHPLYSEFESPNPIEVGFDRIELKDRAQSFFYACEMLRKNYEFILNNFNGTEREHLLVAINRARHSTLHQFLSDVFRQEILSMPKKYDLKWDGQYFSQFNSKNMTTAMILKDRYFFR